jgi:endoglucanase
MRCSPLCRLDLHRRIQHCCRDFLLLAASFIVAGFLIFGGSRAGAAGYLHASGTTIVDGNNQPILLRGVNLGNWLFNESYMTGAPFENNEWPTGLKDVLGTDTNVAVFYALWRSNYISQADIVRIKALGFNSVRVPFDYKLFHDDTTGQPRDDGFFYLDNLLVWCAASSLYAIPDMHGVPGGQRDPGTFYFNSTNQIIASNVWRRIATRYVTNQWIGGYDLINEPFLDIQAEKWRVRDVYLRLTRAIRQVDGNHLIFAEGNYNGGDLYDLDPRWDNNMAFSAHNYWTPIPNTGVFSLANQVALANAAVVPLWMGEFGENSNPWNNAARRAYEGYSLGWAIWPYRICGETIKSVSWAAITPGYQSVLNYWRGTGSKPSQSAAFTALMDMAQRTALPFCTENKDYLDALFRPDFHTNNISFVLNTAPGRIYAADYDLGNQGFAYNDTIYWTTNQGVDYTPWNNGGTNRNDGVDTGTLIDNGTRHYVGWIDSNEWTSYTVVSSAGRPGINIRYASPSGGRIRLEWDGRNITGSLALPATGGFLNWSTLSVTPNTNFTAGVHTLKTFFETDGLNLYWLEFTNLPPLRPVQWLDQDIGEPRRLGFSFLNTNSVWTVAGGGTNISGTADQGHFVSRTFTNDGSIIARVLSVQNTDANAKGGVMFRDSAASNAMYAYLSVGPNLIGFECRTNTGGPASSAGVVVGRAPVWVRLIRNGNSFSAYVSTNAVGWSQVGAARTIPMAITVRAGLAVTARNSNALCAATFDNLLLVPSMTATLVPEGSSWKFNDSGANLGTSWQRLDYDDNSWPSGPAQLGFGDGDEFTLVSSNRQITTYFRRSFLVADPGAFTNLVLRVLRDDGAVAYLNTNEVFRSNMGNGAVNHLTPASIAVPSQDETTNFYSTNVNATLLMPGTNVLAVEVHQNVNTSSDLSFDLSLHGQFARPRLSIDQTRTNITLRWPDFGAFTPLASPALSPSVWTAVTNRNALSNNVWSVTLPPALTPQFYRLRSP